MIYFLLWCLLGWGFYCWYRSVSITYESWNSVDIHGKILGATFDIISLLLLLAAVYYCIPSGVN